MADAPARSTTERLRDTRALLDREVDCWVASSGRDGSPHLVPLSFGLQDGVITMATPLAYRTCRNLAERPEVKLAFGDLRDVVLVHGIATVSDLAEVADDVIEEFAELAGFDPRNYEGNGFIEVRPLRVLAWRGENELAGRTLMRDGIWIDEGEASS